jgi:hypothetical protein
MNLVDSLKDKLGMTKKPSPEAKRVIQRIDVLMQRFEPWRLNEAEAKELNRLLAQQAENQWYFKARDVYAPGPVPRNLYKKSASGGGGANAKALRISTKDPRTMTAGEINKELDRLDTLRSANTRAFIDAGRGHERPSEYLTKTDPLSLAARVIGDRQDALHNEVRARYGLGAPRRLPTRQGFGPRVNLEGGGGARTRAEVDAAELAAREAKASAKRAKAVYHRVLTQYVDPEKLPERRAFFRKFGKKYGLDAVGLDALHRCRHVDRLEQELDAWRQAHGWLATNSPLTRGELMAMVRSGKFT